MSKKLKTAVTYPTVPATYPNRAVRRAVKHNRPLPGTWGPFLAINTAFRAAIKAL